MSVFEQLTFNNENILVKIKLENEKEKTRKKSRLEWKKYLYKKKLYKNKMIKKYIKIVRRNKLPKIVTHIR